MKTMIAFVMVGLLGASVAWAKTTPREVTGTVNLNQATKAELELLPGVGPKTAKMILDYRATKSFEKPEDVRKVKGVGRGIYNKIKGHIAVSGATTLAVVSSRPEAAAAPKAASPAPAVQAKAPATPAAKALPRK